MMGFGHGFIAILAEICNETARHWLHDLGFSQKCHKKGVYFDGHERDVVEHRKEFVAQMNLSFAASTMAFTSTTGW